MSVSTKVMQFIHAFSLIGWAGSAVIENILAFEILDQISNSKETFSAQKIHLRAYICLYLLYFLCHWISRAHIKWHLGLERLNPDERDYNLQLMEL